MQRPARRLLARGAQSPEARKQNCRNPVSPRLADGSFRFPDLVISRAVSIPVLYDCYRLVCVLFSYQRQSIAHNEIALIRFRLYQIRIRFQIYIARGRYIAKADTHGPRNYRILSAVTTSTATHGPRPTCVTAPQNTLPFFPPHPILWPPIYIPLPPP